MGPSIIQAHLQGRLGPSYHAEKSPTSVESDFTFTPVKFFAVELLAAVGPDEPQPASRSIERPLTVGNSFHRRRAGTGQRSLVVDLVVQNPSCQRHAICAILPAGATTRGPSEQGVNGWIWCQQVSTERTSLQVPIITACKQMHKVQQLSLLHTTCFPDAPRAASARTLDWDSRLASL